MGLAIASKRIATIITTTAGATESTHTMSISLRTSSISAHHIGLSHPIETFRLAVAANVPKSNQMGSHLYVPCVWVCVCVMLE